MAGEHIKLVLQIVVDGLRGDLGASRADQGSSPYRFGDALRGGLGSLLDGAAWYTAATHPHSHTETVVGHTTLATGTYPSVHGMISNSWFDAQLAGERAASLSMRPEEAAPADRVFAAGWLPVAFGLHEIPVVREPQDDESRLDFARPDVGTPAPADYLFGHPADYAEAAASARVVESDYTLLPLEGVTFPGHGPDQILSETLADVIVKEGGRAYAVSTKDRAALAMAGHRGKAFWFFNSSQAPDGPVPPENLGRYVSSTFYFRPNRYPEWAVGWNDQRMADEWDKGTWDLSRPLSTYSFPNEAPAYLNPGVPYLKFAVFPLVYGDMTDPADYYYTKVASSPASDELTGGFAATMLEHERIGQGGTTDYLAVSFSATDMINHVFGPSTLQAEDNLIRLDVTIGRLLDAVDRHVGLENTLVVLTGDHGVPEPYQMWVDYGAGQIDVDNLTAQTRHALGADYDRLVDHYQHPYFYLKASLHPSDLRIAARRIAGIVQSFNGVQRALPWYALDDPGDEIQERMSHNQHPVRSGHVYVLQDVFWQVKAPASSGEAMTVLNHGSPYGYDTWVPIAFMHPSIERAPVDRPVSTVDVAPTIASFIGLRPPADSAGSVLPEAVQHR